MYFQLLCDPLLNNKLFAVCICSFRSLVVQKIMSAGLSSVVRQITRLRLHETTDGITVDCKVIHHSKIKGPVVAL